MPGKENLPYIGIDRRDSRVEGTHMFPMEVQELILPNITVSKIYAKPFLFPSTSEMSTSSFPISQMKKLKRVR